MPNQNSEIDPISYYEYLGYDTLVPNPKFAQYLNINGEVIVQDSLVKITPEGTFIVHLSKEEELRKYLSSTKTHTGRQISNQTYQIAGFIKFIKTFETNKNDYTFISEGEYEPLPEDYFEEESIDAQDAGDNVISSYASSNEPDFSKFSIFSANSHTILGKIMQNIIGSTKSHKVDYNSKRRLKGSFYFYNYGVYGEIGVKGWTDKKNWLNWSKTASEELRVGWKNVVIDIPMTDDMKNAVSGMKALAYQAPLPVNIDNRNVATATLLMPETPPDFWDKVIAQGTKWIINFIKNKYGAAKAKDIEKSQAFVIATPTKLRFVANDQDVIRYGENSYCHVFANEYANFTIGWTNTNGYYLNDVNLSDAGQISTWIKSIIKLITRDHMTLVSGEVYVCAKLGGEWRGMKIIKN